jgi:hypothetical protein
MGKFGSSPVVDVTAPPELAGLLVVPGAVPVELDGEIGAGVAAGAG